MTVGDVPRTTLPVPVLVVTPVPPLATAKVPATVTAPVVAVDGVRPVEPKVMEVTPVLAMVIEPDALVTLIPVPGVNVPRVNPEPLPISIAPFAGVVVNPVPP